MLFRTHTWLPDIRNAHAIHRQPQQIIPFRHGVALTAKTVLPDHVRLWGTYTQYVPAEAVIWNVVIVWHIRKPHPTILLLYHTATPFAGDLYDPVARPKTAQKSTAQTVASLLFAKISTDSAPKNI